MTLHHQTISKAALSIILEKRFIKETTLFPASVLISRKNRLFNSERQMPMHQPRAHAGRERTRPQLHGAQAECGHQAPYGASHRKNSRNPIEKQANSSISSQSLAPVRCKQQENLYLPCDRRRLAEPELLFFTARQHANVAKTPQRTLKLSQPRFFHYIMQF